MAQNTAASFNRNYDHLTPVLLKWDQTLRCFGWQKILKHSHFVEVFKSKLSFN